MTLRCVIIRPHRMHTEHRCASMQRGLRACVCVCLLVTNLHVLKRLNQQCRLGCGLRWAHKLVPLPFLNVLIHWYSKCFAYVRWGSFVSSTFQIFAGVRQGGVLPPHFMLYLLIQLLVNYELQVLVLALASFSSVVCFMLYTACLSLTA